MNETIVHRGPDAEGLFADEACALGMRRLSVIDLAGGNQPIENTAGDKRIILNGEIYNYRELREELLAEGCVFHTKSDVEVVLLGIEKHGKDFVKRLDGMFAFCLYDERKQTWLFARDRAGEKPLYYYQNQDIFLFGSELKSLLSTGLIPKEIDPEALSIYFSLGSIPAPLSIFQGVKKLLPATLLEVDATGGTTLSTYWELDPSEPAEYQDYDFCKTKLREALYRSVRRRMISDVPLGAFLSGGFDSATIVGIMSDLSEHPVETFTIGFREKAYDESDLAALVAKRNGTKHHVLTLDWNEAEHELDRILDNIDEPFADSSLVATYLVSKMAREYVTVTLTGDAGDELFAGYNKYLMSYYSALYRKVPKPLRNGVVRPLLNALPKDSGLYRKGRKVVDYAEESTVSQMKRLLCRAFPAEEEKELLPNIPVSPMTFLDEQYEEAGRKGAADEMKRIQAVDFYTLLESQMLPKIDRGSMLASLETRVPMLSVDVIETAFHTPSEYKIKKKERKLLLKDTFRDLLPDELFHAPKHGFDVPVGAWLTGTLKKEFDHYTAKEFLNRQGLFFQPKVDALLQTKSPYDLTWVGKVWAFFVFQRWYEREWG